jgi:decaprenylphospho-beta-D-ribofuranose 2-oxidase
VAEEPPGLRGPAGRRLAWPRRRPGLRARSRRGLRHRVGRGVLRQRRRRRGPGPAAPGQAAPPGGVRPPARAILDTGDHLPGPEPLLEPDGLGYAPPRARRLPPVPFCPVTPWSARGFNSLWFHRAPRQHSGLAGLPGYFHRLDAVDGWNRAAGPAGLVQYQFVVPDGSEKLLARALEVVQQYRCAPFLGTLKRFGPASGGALSFPLPGWSLAIDMPAGRPGLGPALDGLDHDVANAGGRVYLAKDARLGRAAFERMYGPPDGWRAARETLDPHGVFRSDLGRRLGLCDR